MQKFIRTSAALMLVLSLGACKSEVDEAIGKMKKFSDDMCACKDKACAEKVTAEMTKYGEEAAKKDAAKATTPTEAQAKEMVDSSKKMGECMAKAMGG